MKIYKIECEWDMGFKEAYKTRKAAEQAIKDTDWSDILEGDSVETLIEDGLLKIVEVKVA